jgi:hypothetical protein
MCSQIINSFYVITGPMGLSLSSFSFFLVLLRHNSLHELSKVLGEISRIVDVSRCFGTEEPG